jgi:hypothetical protein
MPTMLPFTNTTDALSACTWRAIQTRPGYTRRVSDTSARSSKEHGVQARCCATQGRPQGGGWDGHANSAVCSQLPRACSIYTRGRNPTCLLCSQQRDVHHAQAQQQPQQREVADVGGDMCGQRQVLHKAARFPCTRGTGARGETPPIRAQTVSTGTRSGSQGGCAERRQRREARPTGKQQQRGHPHLPGCPTGTSCPTATAATHGGQTLCAFSQSLTSRGTSCR